MQQTLLLTLQGPRRKLDIELPGDVPVSDLLPLLQQICGDSIDVSRWSVSRLMTGKSLKAANTLFENKVLDGEVLLLHKEGSPVGSRPAKRQDVPATYTQGGSITVTWEK